MKKKLVDSCDKGLSIRRQCQLLPLNRGSLYYSPVGESQGNLDMMKHMDAHILEEPTAGVVPMQDMLEEKGYKAGYERFRSVVRKATIMPIYPSRQLTILGQKKYVHPYLLRNLDVERPNQVWIIDITYIPVKSGFVIHVQGLDRATKKHAIRISKDGKGREIDN